MLQKLAKNKIISISIHTKPRTHPHSNGEIAIRMSNNTHIHTHIHIYIRIHKVASYMHIYAIQYYSPNCSGMGGGMVSPAKLVRLEEADVT